jgi:hypothetical protein
MQSNGPFKPTIVWRARYNNRPDREPVEVDVQDGRAEYVLSGPYHFAEGSKIEVIHGQLLFTGSCAKVS